MKKKIEIVNWKNPFKFRRKKFKCQRCGNCCKYYAGSLTATTNDILRWKMQRRNDILSHVFIGINDKKDGLQWVRGDKINLTVSLILSLIFNYDIVSGNLWFNPETGGELVDCPFLKKDKDNKHTCLIHDTKPIQCRKFPFDKKDNAREDVKEICSALED